MRTIEIENDVYDHLLRNSAKIGESASEIIRRLLNIPVPGVVKNENLINGTNVHNQIPRSPIKTKSEISEYLNSPSFQAKRKAIDKFFGILSHVYKNKPVDFSRVLTLTGRNRKYFALSSEELEDSGKSVFPQQIPGSSYWVITNNDTPKKRRMLEDVLRILGYSKQAIEEAANYFV